MNNKIESPENISTQTSNLTQQMLLNRITNNIRQSLELQEILSASMLANFLKNCKSLVCYLPQILLNRILQKIFGSLPSDLSAVAIICLSLLIWLSLSLLRFSMALSSLFLNSSLMDSSLAINHFGLLYMKNLLAFSVFSTTSVLILLHIPLAKAVLNNLHSFEQGCLQKDSLQLKGKDC